MCYPYPGKRDSVSSTGRQLGKLKHGRRAAQLTVARKALGAKLDGPKPVVDLFFSG